MKSTSEKLEFEEKSPKKKNQSKPAADFKLPPDAHLLPADELCRLFRRGELGNRPRHRPLDFQAKWNDPRLNLLKLHYFLEREVLDVGCGDGSLTIQLALKYFPKKLTGVDLDGGLIGVARKNVDRFVKPEEELGLYGKAVQQAKLTTNPILAAEINQILSAVQQLPECFISRLKSPTKQCRSPVYSIQPAPIIPPMHPQPPSCPPFPKNLTFLHSNIFDLKPQSHSYDTILCLSLTKHLQLSFGDQSVIDLFKHFRLLLRDKGYLILEAQPWSSYRKDRNDFPMYQRNYENVKLKPSGFRELLKGLGFKLLEEIRVNYLNQKLNKPLTIYTKQS